MKSKSKRQRTIYLGDALDQSIQTLADLQRRSVNDMIVLTLEAGIEAFRQEWKQSGGKLPVPRKSVKLADAWDAECEAKFGKR